MIDRMAVQHRNYSDWADHLRKKKINLHGMFEIDVPTVTQLQRGLRERFIYARLESFL